MGHFFCEFVGQSRYKVWPVKCHTSSFFGNSEISEWILSKGFFGLNNLAKFHAKWQRRGELVIWFPNFYNLYFIGRDPCRSRPFILWLDVFTLWYEQLSVRLIESSRRLQYLIISWTLINFTIAPILHTKKLHISVNWSIFIGISELYVSQIWLSWRVRMTMLFSKEKS